MLNIVKGPEPACLTELRRTPGASWASVHGDQKAQLREAAVLEQGGLCAYCMRSIRAAIQADGNPGCTVEHWDARASGGAHFAWPNLLAVCRGDLAGGPHCDKSRGDKALSLHPADPRCEVERLVSFTADGRARCDAHPNDIQTLNLNHPTLVRSRREIVDLLRKRLEGADLTQLHAAEAAWDRRPERPEYAGVALPIIRRLIRQREGRSERTRGQRP